MKHSETKIGQVVRLLKQEPFCSLAKEEVGTITQVDTDGTVYVEVSVNGISRGGYVWSKNVDLVPVAKTITEPVYTKQEVIVLINKYHTQFCPGDKLSTLVNVWLDLNLKQ